MEYHRINVVWVLLCKRVRSNRANRKTDKDNLLPFLAIDFARAKFPDQLVNRLYVSLCLSFEKPVGIRAVSISCNGLSLSTSTRAHATSTHNVLMCTHRPNQLQT